MFWYQNKWVLNLRFEVKILIIWLIHRYLQDYLNALTLKTVAFHRFNEKHLVFQIIIQLGYDLSDHSRS